MNKYIQYLKYVLRHKYHVYKEGRKLGLGVLQLLLHDMSKFSILEFVSYANYFYGNSEEKEKYTHLFKRAWLHHLHWNKHHWQYWVLVNDSDGIEVLEMPDKYIREMVADWIGASICITGTNNAKSWYKEHKTVYQLGITTRKKVEALLDGTYSDIIWM